jgi:hypothetical protein
MGQQVVVQLQRRHALQKRNSKKYKISNKTL